MHTFMFDVAYVQDEEYHPVRLVFYLTVSSRASCSVALLPGLGNNTLLASTPHLVGESTWRGCIGGNMIRM